MDQKQIEEINASFAAALPALEAWADRAKQAAQSCVAVWEQYLIGVSQRINEAWPNIQLYMELARAYQQQEAWRQVCYAHWRKGGKQ